MPKILFMRDQRKIGRPRADHTGERYGALTALREVLGDDDRFYWECLCECGQTRLVETAPMVRGRYAHCICTKDTSSYRRKAERNAPGVSARNVKYATCRASARSRDLVFELTIDDFSALSSQTCHYCGDAPRHYYTRRGYAGTFIYNGIDRKVNNEGYTLANCVTCCQECNYAKRERDYDEFREWLGRVTRYQQSME